MPADLRTDKVAQFGDVAALVRSYNDAQKLIGKKGLTRPPADADPAAWDAYWAAIGRPKEPTAYEYAPPEGFELVPEQYGEAQKAFHGLGLAPEQFKGVMDFYVQLSQQELQKHQTAQLQARDATLQALQSEYGELCDAKLQAAQRVVSKYGLADAFKAAGLGNDANVMRAMIALADATREDTVIRGPAGPATGGGIDAQIKSVRESAEFRDGRHPKHGAAVARLVELTTQKHRQAGAPI